jgi:small subunit ribosomal protein S4
MGDPKKQRKKYSMPGHPWEKARIEEEKELKQIYNFKNKKELWKAYSLLRKFMRDAKALNAKKDTQGEKEQNELLKKLVNIGLLAESSNLSDVLNIELNQILERRLQTLLFKKGMSKTMNQARQFIVHRHVTVHGKVITQPSYLVSKSEEGKISFRATSALRDNEHPERTIVKEEITEEKKETEDKTKKTAKKKATKKEKTETKKEEKKTKEAKAAKQEEKPEEKKESKENKDGKKD